MIVVFDSELAEKLGVMEDQHGGSVALVLRYTVIKSKMRSYHARLDLRLSISTPKVVFIASHFC